MNIFQSWSREVEGFTMRSKVIGFLNIKTWQRAMRYRKQRLERGFSDQDMWAGGEYIMQMISDSLKWFETNSVSDWEFMFEQWRKDKTDFGYKSLKQIYTDIDNYLAHERTSWSDGLTVGTDIDTGSYLADVDDTGRLKVSWVVKDTLKTLTDKQLTKRMKAHQDKGKKLHEKATNALMCWSRHAVEFWD